MAWLFGVMIGIIRIILATREMCQNQLQYMRRLFGHSIIKLKMLFGRHCSQKKGWFCRSMQIAGTSFIIGSIFQASACCGYNHRFLLFIGRIFWGVGVGFGDHCVRILSPLYLFSWKSWKNSCCWESGTLPNSILQNFSYSVKVK